MERQRVPRRGRHRTVIRTLTPLGFDGERLELDVEIVLHGHGPLSTWASRARPGDRAAISGTGRGYDIDQAARSFLLAGDESALPAIAMLLDVLPSTADVAAFIEVAHPSGRRELEHVPAWPWRGATSRLARRRVQRS